MILPLIDSRPQMRVIAGRVPAPRDGLGFVHISHTSGRA